jgi:hypothetical protein
LTDTEPALIAALAALSIPTLPTPLELTGDWLIVGDVHAPYVSPAYALRVVQVARKNKVKNLLIAGDFWDYSNHSIYDDVVPPASWQTEKAAGKRIIQEWGAWFSRVEFLMGNHERRKEKKLQGHEDDEDIFSPLAAVCKNMHSTNYGWAEVYSGSEKYRITHPKAYSINQLTVADALALKYDCHVISFHEHHLAIGLDRYGRHIIINGGCLVDCGALAYVALDDSKAAAMVNGFVMVKRGTPTLFGPPPFTDWGYYDQRSR